MSLLTTECYRSISILRVGSYADSSRTRIYNSNIQKRQVALAWASGSPSEMTSDYYKLPYNAVYACHSLLGTKESL